MFRIVIAAHDLPVRAALARVLSSEAGLKVVGQARGATATLELVRRADADVVLVDLAGPASDAIDTIAVVHRLHPGVLIVAVLEEASESLLRGAFDAGASAFLQLAAGAPDEQPVGWTSLLPQDSAWASDGTAPRHVEMSETWRLLRTSVVPHRPGTGEQRSQHRPGIAPHAGPTGREWPGSHDRRARSTTRRRGQDRRGCP